MQRRTCPILLYPLVARTGRAPLAPDARDRRPYKLSTKYSSSFPCRGVACYTRNSRQRRACPIRLCPLVARTGRPPLGPLVARTGRPPLGPLVARIAVRVGPL